jgi:hypothetical protein
MRLILGLPGRGTYPLDLWVKRQAPSPTGISRRNNRLGPLEGFSFIERTRLLRHSVSKDESLGEIRKSGHLGLGRRLTLGLPVIVLGLAYLGRDFGVQFCRLGATLHLDQEILQPGSKVAELGLEINDLTTRVNVGNELVPVPRQCVEFFEYEAHGFLCPRQNFLLFSEALESILFFSFRRAAQILQPEDFESEVRSDLLGFIVELASFLDRFIVMRSYYGGLFVFRVLTCHVQPLRPRSGLTHRSFVSDVPKNL